jgi:hypothetical protein
MVNELLVGSTDSCRCVWNWPSLSNSKSLNRRDHILFVYSEWLTKGANSLRNDPRQASLFRGRKKVEKISTSENCFELSSH